MEVVGSSDESANGLYCKCGEHSRRPFYRLLGAQPRYLYYQEDPAWPGWWIADKTGSDDYVEWFKHPSDAMLPTFCQKGEMNAKVMQTSLTRQAAERVSMISSQIERTTIRQILTEKFGNLYTRFDGTQRNLMTKSSPMVGIASALESQQKALQLLHSQLAAETQRREAAEVHAMNMEEAFETLQMRISMALPDVGAISAGLEAGHEPYYTKAFEEAAVAVA